MMAARLRNRTPGMVNLLAGSRSECPNWHEVR